MARRPFLRHTFPILAGLLLLAPAVAQTPEGRGASPRRPYDEEKVATVRKGLNTPVTFSGFDDPGTKLDDVLRHLERLYGVSFTVNAQAFKDEEVTDVLDAPIGKEIPKLSNVTLSTVLRKILERIPSTSGTTWVIGAGEVEITTVSAYRAEFYPGRSNGPFPPLVFTNIEQKPLEEALKKLADDAGANVVLDVRAGDRAKMPVSARLGYVPLDTAVLLLADMAGLKSVEIDGVYYVTTRENARSLREDQGKSPLKKTDKRRATGATPAAGNSRTR